MSDIKDESGSHLPSAVHRSLGLTDDEYRMIMDELEREPRPVELAMYSVMWSEHCSYKSSRLHLKRLPSEGQAVLVGPPLVDAATAAARLPAPPDRQRKRC